MTGSGGRGIITRRVEISAVHGDLSQQIVQITVDRLWLVLEKHVSRTQRNKEWIAPFGILVSILLTFASTTFRDHIISAPTWSALFILLAVADVIWLVVTLFRLRRAETVEDLVERIKANKP